MRFEILVAEEPFKIVTGPILELEIPKEDMVGWDCKRIRLFRTIILGATHVRRTATLLQGGNSEHWTL